jgi:hypothetical protein
MPYGGNPSTVAADAVRALVGDTDPDSPLLDDDTYTMILAQESNVYLRASLACSALASKWAPQMTHRIGDLWREAKVVYTHFQKQAQWLRLEGQRRGLGHPFAGGANKDDRGTRRDDTDVVQPNFTVGMQDYDGSCDGTDDCTCSVCGC